MSDTGRFTTSSHYLPALPQWVLDFNAARPADAYFHRVWEPLLPGWDCPQAMLSSCAYARSVPDNQGWQVAGGNGNRLPAVMGASRKCRRVSTTAICSPRPLPTS